MGTNSKIEWTDHTFNPWRGCTKVSAGCAHCYAETMSKRNPTVLGIWGKHGQRVVAAESYWRQPLKWSREAAQAGERRRVFCASLADVFEDSESMPEASWPLVQAARRRLFRLIGDTPALDWLLLTKRPQHIMTVLRDELNEASFPPNVWLGTSVENQAAADERIPHLLRAPAAVRFLSCEPLLGAVDLSRLIVATPCWHCGNLDGEAGRCYCGVTIEPEIHWVIVGGESGAQARPMHQRWVRSLRDQCRDAGVAYFFKQHGEWIGGGDWEYDTMKVIEERSLWAGRPNDPNDLPTLHYRVGKHAAGRLLDGREHNDMPDVTVGA